MVAKVVHCKKEPYDIYIGRTKEGNKWGNPFPLADAKDEEGRKRVFEEYKEWVRKQPKLMNSLHELRDKRLGCWCAPRLCHGDYLSYLANDTPGTLRLIVAGSRTFDDYPFMKECIDKIAIDYNDLIIIEGEAKGADLLGRRYAEEHGYDFIPMPAIWNDGDDNFDRLAGFKRNENMAKIANALLAFHHNASAGTADMIKRADKYKLKKFIYKL